MSTGSSSKIRQAGFIFFSLFISISSIAQLNSANLIQYSEKDGLPGVQVRRIISDKQGYLWFGTINGLARYDGYGFKRFYYDPNDSTSIHGLSVWSLYEDHKGNIWSGTSPSSLNKYDPVSNKFKQFDFTHLVKHAANIEVGISAICEDNHGRMYFGVDTYLGDEIATDLLYKDAKEDSIKRFIAPDSLIIKNVVHMDRDKWGNIWCLSYSGFFRIDTSGVLMKMQALDPFLSKNDYATDFRFDKNGHMWLITASCKLVDFNTESGEYKSWSSNLYTATAEKYPFKFIVLDREENIWIGTDEGVQFFNRKNSQFSKFNNGVKKELEHVPVLDLAFDYFGTLWIGTFTNGLIKYEDKPQLRSFVNNNTQTNSITRGWANSLFEASDGKIWMTTSGAGATSGINILNTRTWNLQPLPFSRMSNKVNGAFCIWEHAPGEMYFSSFKAMYSYSEKTHKLNEVKLAGAPDTIIITYYFKDSKENEWLCTMTGLFKKVKGDTQFRKYDLSLLKNGDASSNEITRAYESKLHGLWLLTNNGLFLYHYDTDKIERHGFDKKEGDIFVTQDINSFYEDPDGMAWVGTWQGGLSKYDLKQKKIKSYTRNDGLPSMSIQAILADEKNNALWLSTFEGLSRFDRKTGQFLNFSIEDGIQGQLFADGSLLKTSSGLFVFGGANGITIFNPDSISSHSSPPKVFLTGLKLSNQPVIPGEKSILKKPIYETESIELDYAQNNIALEFIAIHYSNPSKNKYSYKLENYDNEWREVGSQRNAFYPNLPPGEYTFRVKASNDKGIWNEEGASLQILVNPPWWKTNWAYILYAMLLGALIFAADRYLRSRLIRREREKNRLRELEQAREIQKAYHKLEEAHEALKSTQTQLIQSEKMASLGELTAGIAHEIQNPLNFVNNFSEINTELIEELNGELKSGHVPGAFNILDNIRENEQKINHHGKRADSIVKGMLQHSRLSSGQKEFADLNAIADEYLRLSYHGLRAKNKQFNASIETDFDEQIGQIEIIPQDIGRVLLNLYNNAFYAVSEKQQIMPTGFEPRVSVSTKKLPGKIEIRVKDNGNGIPQKIADKIFQPFFTTKPAGEGTGLGLSLAYDIITKGHSGELRMETKEGYGSEFIIVLPTTQGKI